MYLLFSEGASLLKNSQSSQMNNYAKTDEFGSKKNYEQTVNLTRNLLKLSKLCGIIRYTNRKGNNKNEEHQRNHPRRRDP